MGFPDKKMIDEVLKELENVEGTIVGPKSNEEIDVFRHQIQQAFAAYVNQNKLTGRQLSSMIGVDESKVSKILRNRLESFSTDKLVEWYKRINPNFKIKLVA